jgi:signal transduction histidine kinase
VIVGLLENALKFGAGRPVVVTLRREGDRAHVTVRDQGIGIPVEVQDRLFGRFERAVPARHFGGLGLGLFRARRVVEAHGGTIRLVSEAGRGATFVIDLPCRPADG